MTKHLPMTEHVLSNRDLEAAYRSSNPTKAVTLASLTNLQRAARRTFSDPALDLFLYEVREIIERSNVRRSEPSQFFIQRLETLLSRARCFDGSKKMLVVRDLLNLLNERLPNDWLDFTDLGFATFVSPTKFSLGYDKSVVRPRPQSRA